jgi:hypothetical protein
VKVSKRLLFSLLLLLLTGAALAIVYHSKRNRPRTDFKFIASLKPVGATYDVRLGKEALISRTYLVEKLYQAVCSELVAERPGLKDTPMPKGPGWREFRDGDLLVQVYEGTPALIKDRAPGLRPKDLKQMEQAAEWVLVDVTEPAGREYLPASLLFRLWEPAEWSEDSH